MKKITKLLSFFLVAALLLTSFPLQTQAAVKLNKTKTTIYIGQTRTLKLTGTKKEVVWTTSSKKSLLLIAKVT